MRTQFVNGTIFDGEKFQENTVVLVENGVIESVSLELFSSDCETYDLNGGILAPGFVDIQVNGGGGVMFNDAPSIETIETMVSAHKNFGTTSLLPTLISTDFKTMTSAANVIKKALKNKIKGVLGIHFEGPYLNKLRKGVHDEHIIRPVDNDSLTLLSQPECGITVVTLAPENVPDFFIRELFTKGTKICAGHTAATYQQMQSAFENGVTGITHLFNAMTPFESRTPGVVGAALENESCWCGIIVDGYHIHPASLKVAIKAKVTGKMMLVTDAMATVGSESNEFQLNNETIIAKDGKCATSNGTLAGSDLNMCQAVRNCIKMIRIEPAEALRMASLYPAMFLGISNSIGFIKEKYRADLVHLDKEFNPIKTWIGGEA